MGVVDKDENSDKHTQRFKENHEYNMERRYQEETTGILEFKIQYLKCKKIPQIGLTADQTLQKKNQ